MAGTSRRLAGALVAVVGMTGALASPAIAQDDRPFQDLFVTIDQSITHTRGATTLTFITDSGYNEQGVSGTLFGNPFVGTAFLHTYDQSQDRGHYELSGTATGPTGAPLPFAGQLTVTYDRMANIHQGKIEGTLAGQPVSEESPTLNIPTGYQLLGGG